MTLPLYRMFFVVSLYAGSVGAVELTDARDCALAMSDAAYPRQTIDDLLAFITLDHPVQITAIERSTTIEQILFWIHWSAGFRFPTEPSRYHPDNPQYSRPPRKKRNWLGLPRLMNPPQTVYGYLKNHLSTDGFVQYLRRESWPKDPPWNFLNSEMKYRVQDYGLITQEGGWTNQSELFRARQAEFLIDGLREGMVFLRRNSVTAQKFLLPPGGSYPEDFKIYLRNTCSDDDLKTMEILGQALRNPLVASALQAVLERHLPTLVARRDDFKFRRSPKPNNGAADWVNIPSREDADLEDLKRYLFRRTGRLERVRELRMALAKNTFAPLSGSRPLTEHDALPAPATISAGSNIDELEASWRESAGRDPDGPVEDIPGWLTEAARLESRLSTNVEFAARLAFLRRARDLHAYLRRAPDITTGLALVGALSELKTKLTEAEAEASQSLALIETMSADFLRDHGRLLNAIEAIGVGSEIGGSVTPAQLAQAGHFQDVYRTFAPLGPVWRNKELSTRNLLETLRSAKNGLYLLNVRFAADPSLGVAASFSTLARVLRDSLVADRTEDSEAYLVK